jgi:hypothetical protein
VADRDEKEEEKEETAAAQAWWQSAGGPHLPLFQLFHRGSRGEMLPEPSMLHSLLTPPSSVGDLGFSQVTSAGLRRPVTRGPDLQHHCLRLL